MAASFETILGVMDVGLEGGDLHTAAEADTRLIVEEGPRLERRVLMTFPGFSGALSHRHGTAPRVIRWRLALRVTDLETLLSIEDAIAEHMEAGEGTLTLTTDRVLYRTVLHQHLRGAGWKTIRGGARNGWVLRDDVIEFVNLAP